eukprot:TRINITY_DN68182_c5_g1_i1.p1 TRINITY_DN68182_c5_g1~~TRINITY_DN68182_c5_g1_i1.p1  ORF type:complete len:205 (-),score=32.87 TRINITY_DN68182_c5_g1_i1:437-1051(-)
MATTITSPLKDYTNIAEIPAEEEETPEPTEQIQESTKSPKLKEEITLEMEVYATEEQVAAADVEDPFPHLPGPPRTISPSAAATSSSSATDQFRSTTSSKILLSAGGDTSKPRQSVAGVSKWRRRWNKTPKKIVAMCFILFSGGITLLLLGLLCLAECEETGRAIGMIVIGGIMLLPGSYSAYILVNYWRGVRGFHHNQLPQFD